MKVWALTAYLLLSDSPVPRNTLVDLLFADADDPRAALRWNLAELRKVLGAHGEVGGDPVTVTLRGHCKVDVLEVLAGANDAARLPGLTQDLLAPLHLDSCAAFEAWLTTERSRVRRACADLLAAAARTAIHEGAPRRAAHHALQLLQLDDLDENHHELLVAALGAAGAQQAAREHATSASQLFFDQLEEPTAFRSNPPPARNSVATILAHIDAGGAAIRAGLSDRGLAHLRRAASTACNTDVEAVALLELGTALTHCGTGLRRAAQETLHAAIESARKLEDAETAALASLELAWVDVSHGRQDEAIAHAQQSQHLAPSSSSVEGRAAVIRARVANERGRYDEASSHLTAAIPLLQDQPHPLVFALSLLARYGIGRGHLLEGETTLARAMEVARRSGWTALLPLPEAFFSEFLLRQGDPHAATDAAEHALGLARSSGDTAMIAAASRSLALTKAERDHVEPALELLDGSVTGLRRTQDQRWCLVTCLDTAAAITVRVDHPTAPAWVESLMGASVGMPDFVARARHYRWLLGDAAAGEAARQAAAATDNERIRRMVTMSLDQVRAADLAELATV